MGSVAFILEELSCTSKRCIHGQYYHILLALQNFQFSSRTHTAHTTVSWPNPKQWIIIHASDLMMIARQRIYSLNHHKGNGSTENTQPHLLYKDNSENMLNLTHTLTKYIWQTFISSMSSVCTMTIMRGCNVQTNAICKPKRIRLFALIINCAIIMKTKSRYSRNIYSISDRIWCIKHLRHIATKKCDQHSLRLILRFDNDNNMSYIYICTPFNHLNWNEPLEHIQPHV